MRVEQGGLRPATAYDQEVINSYRIGSIVSCRFVPEGQTWRHRKFFAIVRQVIKSCPTPWKTIDQAVEAIKLALGYVNLGKTISGNFMQYPRSITEMDEPEFKEFYDQALVLLEKITGVDPLTLQVESADVGTDEVNESPDGDAITSGDKGGAVDLHPPSGAALSQSDTNDNRQLTDADWIWVRQAAKQLWAASMPDGDPTVVKMTAKSVGTTMPADAPKLAKEKARTITGLCFDVCENKTTVELARKQIAGIAGTEETELGGIQ
jgi:hypothetical protein